MLSKSQVSFVKTLHLKKFRKQHGLFIVEGIKSINDFLASKFRFHSIFFNETYSEQLQHLSANIKLFEVNNAEIGKLTTLQAPQGILALIYLPDTLKLEQIIFKNKFTLVLDDVQDPGNLGSIIRTADWFGIENIICSEATADVWNPKTVQATMGSLSKVKVIYTDLEGFLSESNLPIFGALLNGNNIYETKWGDEGLIILGNEGSGISEKLLQEITHKITIPRIGKAESLNVSISAAIICSELARLKKL